MAQSQKQSVQTSPCSQDWLEAYDYATDRGAAVLNESGRVNDPFGKVGKQSVAVENRQRRASFARLVPGALDRTPLRPSDLGSLGVLELPARPTPGAAQPRTSAPSQPCPVADGIPLERSVVPQRRPRSGGDGAAPCRLCGGEPESSFAGRLRRPETIWSIQSRFLKD